MASNSNSILSNINTPIFSEGVKIIEIFYQLLNADEEIGDLLKTINHITLNVENVRRLRRLNASLLSTRELAWIDALIGDTTDAIGGLATLVEGARVDKETKERISWWNKGCWVAYFGPKVKDKYLKLTMCHQSLLSVFPFLFNNRSGLASVPEESKGDDQQPCDLNMMKWLGWQDQRQQRKSSTNLRTPPLPQRPISASSTLTDMTLASAVSLNSSVSTEPTSSEASSPEIGISYHPAASSQPYFPTSATISPQTHRLSSNSYNEKDFSRSRKSLLSCECPDLVTDSLDLTYAVIHNQFEDNYDPPSALPEDAPDTGNDDAVPSTKTWNNYDGADGLQVYVPLDGSEVLSDLVHQFQKSSFGAQTASSSHKIATERESDGRVNLTEVIRHKRAFSMPHKVNAADNLADTVHKGIPAPSPPFSSYLPPFDFERPVGLIPSSAIGQSSEIRSLDESKDVLDESSLENKKPPIDRAHSDTYTPRYPGGGGQELSQSGRVNRASGGGRSLSAGQRGARRGSRSWLVFHSSRSDLLRQGDGWGEG